MSHRRLNVSALLSHWYLAFIYVFTYLFIIQYPHLPTPICFIMGEVMTVQAVMVRTCCIMFVGGHSSQSLCKWMQVEGYQQLVL